MDNSLSKRRLAENEVIFRELNQKVIQGLVELKELAQDHGQSDLAPDLSQQLHFYCECSALDCRERVIISPEDYEEIHRNDRYFIITDGHQTPAVESVVKKHATYTIVEKNPELSQVVSE